MVIMSAKFYSLPSCKQMTWKLWLPPHSNFAKSIWKWST